MTPAPGYSGKPVCAKLGIKPGEAVLVLGFDTDYVGLIGGLPDGAWAVTTGDARGFGMIHLFATERRMLSQRLREMRDNMRPDAAIWVSWPKNAAKIDTDITEDVIRAEALPLDLVDIKVCAVGEIWSGLKLVIRKRAR